MKKLCLLLAILTVCCAFTACSKNKAPDGLTLCRSGEEFGYTFYTPEGWTIANFGDLSAAYVTSVNPTSVSLTAVDCGADKAAYFEAQKSQFAYAVTMEKEGVALSDLAAGLAMGNAEGALAFLYTFTYKEENYRSLQVIGDYAGRSYLFTYTSFTKSYEGEETVFDHYWENAKLSLSNIVFSAYKAPAADYKTDADGYALVSDKAHAKCKFYMAPAFTLTTANGMIAMYADNGATVSLAPASGSNSSMTEYVAEKKAELSALVDADSLDWTDEGALVDFGNAKAAMAYGYTYAKGGVTYKVYQVFAVSKNVYFDFDNLFFSRRAYVFTYTAKEADFDVYYGDVLKMTQKVKF